jgi:hypothetical protein
VAADDGLIAPIGDLAAALEHKGARGRPYPTSSEVMERAALAALVAAEGLVSAIDNLIAALEAGAPEPELARLRAAEQRPRSRRGGPRRSTTGCAGPSAAGRPPR